MLVDVLNISLLATVYFKLVILCSLLDTKMPRVRRAVTLVDDSSRILATPDMATTKLGLYCAHMCFNTFRVTFCSSVHILKIFAWCYLQ